MADERLAASKSGINAAGDVAEYFAPGFGWLIRLEHEDNSAGRIAGRNRAGANEPYTDLQARNPQDREMDI